MAVHHGRDHIGVNGIAPGHLYTPMVAAGMTEEMLDLRRRAGPRHRGDRLGHRLGGGVPGQRRDAVDHRRGAAGGRWAL